MANLYVSKTATNGYGVGNDSNVRGTILTKTTPALSITHAMAVALANDTIVCNQNGASPETYLEAGFLNFQSVLGLTLKADTGYTVIVQTATGADTRVVNVNAAGANCVLGASDSTLIFDGQGVQTRCLTVANCTANTLTIIGVHFIGFTTIAISLDALLTFTMTDSNWLIQGPTTSTAGQNGGINIAPTAAPGTYLIKNGTINLGAAPNSTQNQVAINYSSGSTGATIDIEGVTINGSASSNTNLYGIRLTATGSATGFTVKTNTINLTASVSSATLFVWGMDIQGPTPAVISANVVNITTTGASQVTCIRTISQSTQSITKNVITVTGTSLTIAAFIDGIFAFLPAAGTSTSTVIDQNTLTLPLPAAGWPGHGIGVGSDSSATAGPVGPTGYNNMAGVVVSRNSVNGSNHGVFLGWISNAVVWGNLIQNIVLGCVDKHCGTNYGGTYNGLPTLWTGNIVKAVQDAVDTGALYAKGSVGTIFANNLVLLDDLGPTAGFIKAANDPSGTVIVASGIEFYNNLLYAISASGVLQAVLIGSGTDASTATLKNNNYFNSGSGGFQAGAWVYQENSYNTVAAWVAGQEATATAIDPTFVNLAAADYRVPGTNALGRAGTWADWRAVDYRGRPFWPQPTVGAYEVTSRDLAGTRTGT